MGDGGAEASLQLTGALQRVLRGLLPPPPCRPSVPGLPARCLVYSTCGAHQRGQEDELISRPQVQLVPPRDLGGAPGTLHVHPSPKL